MLGGGVKGGGVKGGCVTGGGLTGDSAAGGGVTGGSVTREGAVGDGVARRKPLFNAPCHSQSLVFSPVIPQLLFSSISSSLTPFPTYPISLLTFHPSHLQPIPDSLPFYPLLRPPTPTFYRFSIQNPLPSPRHPLLTHSQPIPLCPSLHSLLNSVLLPTPLRLLSFIPPTLHPLYSIEKHFENQSKTSIRTVYRVSGVVGVLVADGGGLVARTFRIMTLSGKFSFCRANRLTHPHSKPRRYGPAHNNRI